MREALRNECLYLQSQQFLGGMPEHALDLGVGKRDAAVRVDFRK
jgi:hypothetical protein